MRKMTDPGFDDIHQSKHDLIDLGLPTELAIDFGPSFRPQYINQAAKTGAKHALAVDAHRRELDEGVDFHRADFSRDAIVPWVVDYRSQYPGKCLGIMFDTLLHQYAPIQVIQNLLSVLDHACIGCPVIRKESPNCTFLPAIPENEQDSLFPSSWIPGKTRFIDESSYSWAHWLWGIPPNLLKIWIKREKFDIVAEKTVKRPNAWDWWGCYAIRKPPK